MTPPGAGENGITPDPPQSPRRLRAVESVEAEPAPRTPERLSHNLPLELSSFVGREKELAEVKRLLKNNRLLTLTGSGGCGKTRLALVAAGELLEGFGDGAWLVELASLADTSLVSQAVASALGVREQVGRSPTEALSVYLRTRKVLLVLDNCEHLVEACAELAEALLHSCPMLCVLATSREALGITGEVVWPVPLLSPRPPAPAGHQGCAPVRGGPPLRGAGDGGQPELRSHGAEREGRGAGLLPVRRHPPGPGARGGEGEGVVC